ncbi:MAG: ABC transporter permease [Bacteroidetes bacterium]|nr:ABC transporter permease [Bacteroidota bacterium]
MDEILATIKKNKLRTFLTAFGVFWGIFMIVLMLGIGNGLYTGIKSQFGAMATNSMFMWGGRTTMPYLGMKPGRQIGFKVDDIDYLKHNVPEAKSIIPESQLGGYRGSSVVSRNNRSGTFSIKGQHPDAAEVMGYLVQEGRSLRMSDLDELRKVIVIGENVKNILFKQGEEVIGQTMNVSGVYFKVVGWFKTSRSDGMAEGDLNNVIVPFTTFQRAFNFGDEVGWISVIADDNANIDAIGSKIKRLMAVRHRYHPDDQQAIGGWSGKEKWDEISGLFSGIQIFNWIVGLLTLVAGIVGISNIMLIVVKERTREIGIRKAIGATPRTILSMIIFETVLLTVVAGYLGIALGVLAIENFTSIIPFITETFDLKFSLDMVKNPGIQLKTALQALTLLVIFGGLAGLIPASNAVKIKPIEALRNE